jgi:hypothetical protein
MGWPWRISDYDLWLVAEKQNKRLKKKLKKLKKKLKK